MSAYAEALRRLAARVDYERQARGPTSLRSFRELLSRMGHPEHSLRSVVVLVGTKGKGSTAHHLSALAESLGLRVGLFTSPHLIQYTERIRLQQRPVAPERFGQTLLDLDRWVERQGGFRTVFELLTLTALQIFREEDVDLAVFEAGLGGRLDTTALLPARVLGVTTLHLDHTPVLGDTLSSIIREKIYPRSTVVPVVVGRQLPAFAGAVRRVAQALYHPVLQEGWEYRVQAVQVTPTGTRALLRRAGHAPCPLYTPAIGQVQAFNAALAWMVMETLWGGPLPPRASFASLHLPGRLQQIRQHPPMYVDGAHNALAFQALKTTIDTLHPRYRWIVVLALHRDKLNAHVQRVLRSWNARWVATRTPSPRALPPAKLRSLLPLLAWIGERERPEDAVKYAQSLAEREPHTGVVVTGSFYLSGAILPWLLQTARVPD